MMLFLYCLATAMMLMTMIMASIGTPSAERNHCFLFMEHIVDYLLQTLNILITEPFPLANTPSHTFIQVREANVTGLSSLQRSCPFRTTTRRGQAEDIISLFTCVSTARIIRILGDIRLMGLLIESDFEPASLSLTNFNVSLNISITLPRQFHENGDNDKVRIALGSPPEVSYDQIELKSLSESEGVIYLIGDTVSWAVNGPFYELLQQTLTDVLEKTFKKVNAEPQSC